MTRGFKFSTDTATVAVFDPDALAHRKDDAADWWSSPRNELAEVNAGNMMLVGLGSDGTYSVSLSEGAGGGAGSVSALVKCVSGRLYVGPGEDLPAGGFVPAPGDGYASLQSFEFDPGVYRVTVSKSGPSALEVAIRPEGQEARNDFRSQLLLEG